MNVVNTDTGQFQYTLKKYSVPTWEIIDIDMLMNVTSLARLSFALILNLVFVALDDLFSTAVLFASGARDGHVMLWDLRVNRTGHRSQNGGNSTRQSWGCASVCVSVFAFDGPGGYFFVMLLMHVFYRWSY